MNNNDSTGHGIDGTPTIPQYGVKPAPVPITPCPQSPPFITTSGGYFAGPQSDNYSKKAEEGFTNFPGSGQDESNGFAASLDAAGGFIGLVGDVLSTNQTAIMSLSGAPDVTGQIYYQNAGTTGEYLTGVSLQNNTDSTAYLKTVGVTYQHKYIQLYPGQNPAYQSTSYGTASPYSTSGIVNVPPIFVQNGYNASINIISVNSGGQYASDQANTEPWLPK